MPPSTRRLPRPLVGTILIVAAAPLLLALGLLVARFPVALDRTILTATRAAGPGWLHRMAIDVTALGSGTVLTLVVLGAALLLVVERRPLVAASLVAASWTGGRVVQLVKDAVGRARPDLVDRLVSVTSASFPSAHAANSAVVYLTLAALAAEAQPACAARRAFFGLAILLVAVIGASRVYLGVHWPSDVAAGWAFGVAWALGWWRLTANARASSCVARK